MRVQRFDERVDLDARPAEHQRRRRALDVEHPLQRHRLVRARDHVGDLANARHLAGGRLLARDHDVLGLVQVLLGDRPQPRRHRRRKQRRLTLPGVARGWCRCPRRSPCRASRRLRRARGARTASSDQRSAADVIEDGPGCRPRCRRRARGRGSAASSTRRHRAERRSARCRARICGWLPQPASRARASARAPAPASCRVRCGAPAWPAPVHHRQREGRRLPRARRGLRQQVLTREHQWDRRALNRCRLFVAEGGDGCRSGPVNPNEENPPVVLDGIRSFYRPGG